MHIFVETQMLAVKSNGGIDVIDDIANLNFGHLALLTVVRDAINSVPATKEDCIFSREQVTSMERWLRS